MNKIALTAMCVGALGLVACGGGGSDSPDAGGGITFTDANTTTTPDAAATAKCNPVTNTGCMPGEKCTIRTDMASGLAVTDCAPDGAVALGDACAAVPNENYDDCAATTLCSNGNCREICGSAPNTCGGGGQCSQYGGLFDDVEGAGLCSASCDPVAQDCADDMQGCFLVLATGVATCEGANEAGTAGLECSGPESSPTGCWVNGCAKGHLPFLDPATSGGRALCTPFCTPIGADSSNFAENRLGDSNGLTCPTVGWGSGILAANISCRFLGNIYSNVEAAGTIGVCLDFTAAYGDDTIGSCELQTPGANDPSMVAEGDRWVPGCLQGPTALTGKSLDRSKLPKYQGDVSVLNEVIRANQ